MSTVTSEGRISVAIDGGVAAVELDNPTRRNALTRGMCLELQDLMPRLDQDAAVDVVTLRGAGTTFSAGATIDDLASVLLDPQPDGSRVDRLSRADEAIASLTKPAIALVDGACMGGAWQLASACDFVVASARSTFALTPAKIGVIYPRPGIERLVRQVGQANAKSLLFTGRALSARQAEDIGLTAFTVADDDFDAACASLVATLLERSRFSLHHLKRLVDATAATDPFVDQVWEEAWAALPESPDMGIGITAFLERRQPEFVWRRP
ncbi:crotonase [Frondihabitans sp. PAMC 28766]|uniref:enoyl-CoA hydratase/isomerase family protein n=1 Tax=Frondihabitans sp. PAMC 28766 TaxID=1795630 RepID=UPI00078D982C|nr:enoyl-CoA hydratase/isomerase family protein [Frondihabitans sp. PAMC 28766]AMM18944.1 crotonase [Frondihabitans sp. PAMC 28766]